MSRNTLLLDDVERAIWRIAPAWVGGDTNDVEVREILKTAKRIARNLDVKRHKVTPAELATAAIHEYYSS